MKTVNKEKSKALAEINDWSMEKAEGFLDGEASRRKGVQPSLYYMVGHDDYCLGFRAGYFERQKSGFSLTTE